MKITTKIFQVLNILGYTFPIAFFLTFSVLLIASYGFFLGLFLWLLMWSFYILCVPSHHGGNTLEPLLESMLGVTWCSSPILWFCAIALNVITVFAAHRIYLCTMITHLLYHILITPSPGWYIIFASAIGTFFPWIIGQDAWHKPRYDQLMFYYFLKLFGLYVFATLAYPQWVLLMNLIGSR